MADISLTIKLFGAFRAYGESVTLQLPEGCTGAEVKSRLAEKLQMTDKSLLGDSALATEDEVIGDEVIFRQDSRLAILPPVCGG